MKQGRYAAAAAAYRIALSREPSTDNALNVARALVAGGEASKAAEFLEQWIKNQPKDIAVLKALAEVKFRSGQLAAAREDYMKAIAVVPDDATTLNNFANLLQRLSDPAAKVYAERAVKLEPHNAEYADTLGWILVNTGDVERGLRHLQDARLRSPDNGEIRFHLAFALTKAGRAAEARKELAAAIGGPRRVEDSAEVIQLRKALQL
jgi:Flp pilus assembly protein TadD